MKKKLLSRLLANKAILLLAVLMLSFFGNAQTMQVNILGGAQINKGATLAITAGNSVTFQITNTATGNCSSVNVNDIDITNTADFSITPANPSENIKSTKCKNGKKFLNFTINTNNTICGSATTQVTIRGNNFANFSFMLIIEKAPIISILGGNPLADVIDNNGANIPATATNGTYFGVVETGLTQTRGVYGCEYGQLPS